VNSLQVLSVKTKQVPYQVID